MTDKFHCVVYSRFMVIFLPESIYSVPAEIFYLLSILLSIRYLSAWKFHVSNSVSYKEYRSGVVTFAP